MISYRHNQDLISIYRKHDGDSDYKRIAYYFSPIEINNLDGLSLAELRDVMENHVRAVIPSIEAIDWIGYGDSGLGNGKSGSATISINNGKVVSVKIEIEHCPIVRGLWYNGVYYGN